MREAFGIYERGAPQLRTIRREGGFHPGVAEDGDALEASLGALVDTALAPLGATRDDRAVVRAMVDLNAWQALRDQGLGPAGSVAAAGDLLTRRMAGRQG